MKESFLKSIRHMYPVGVGNAHQHRDLVRCYCMGYTDSLIERGDSAAVESLVPQLSRMADINWWPDSSWKWW